MMRCRPGIVTISKLATVPDQWRITALRYVLRRIRDTLLRGGPAMVPAMTKRGTAPRRRALTRCCAAKHPISVTIARDIRSGAQCDVLFLFISPRMV